MQSRRRLIVGIVFSTALTVCLGLDEKVVFAIVVLAIALVTLLGWINRGHDVWPEFLLRGDGTLSGPKYLMVTGLAVALGVGIILLLPMVG